MGVARAAETDAENTDRYHNWIAEGRHASMEYLAAHEPLRRDPKNVLPGAETVISMAFSYYTPQEQHPGAAKIARYARGSDYHNVLTKLLRRLCRDFNREFGGEWRVCVDSAPLPERYWAVRAGIGFIGRNGQLFIPSHGSYCFLAEILTTVALEPDAPVASTTDCLGCNRCQRACPGGAIDTEKRQIDARRCISFLTIEAGRTADAASFRWPEDIDRHRQIIGCDICQDVCPLNRAPIAASLPQFSMRDAVKTVTESNILHFDKEQFDTVFAGSAVRRAPLQHLQKIIASGNAPD